MYLIKDILNTILCGDALRELKKIPSESIDTVITSPPYYGLRNYNVKGQIGLESSFNEFLDKMIEIMREIKRVVKKEGTIWINFGDCYGGSRLVGHSRGQFDKCLLMQPARFAIRCIDELGLILRLYRPSPLGRGRYANVAACLRCKARLAQIQDKLL